MRNELLNISKHVHDLYRDYERTYLLYHNLDHTKEVVIRAKEIAEQYNLNDRQQFILLASAWFHDTGHLLCEDLAIHEEMSVEIMREYFREKTIDESIVRCIEKCIMATKMPVNPQTLLEQILCDADTFHVGTPEFFSIDQSVWNELELRLCMSIQCRVEKSILFLKAHQFYTSYCQKKLYDGKVKNLSFLKLSQS